jgi:hypothetical protein
MVWCGRSSPPWSESFTLHALEPGRYSAPKSLGVQRVPLTGQHSNRQFGRKLDDLFAKVGSSRHGDLGRGATAPRPCHCACGQICDRWPHVRQPRSSEQLVERTTIRWAAPASVTGGARVTSPPPSAERSRGSRPVAPPRSLVVSWRGLPDSYGMRGRTQCRPDYSGRR